MVKKIKINGTLLAGILFGIALISIVVFLSIKEKTVKENIEPTFTPIEIVWTGKIDRTMTYGRLLFENLDTDAEYKYFIAEPDDVIADGGLRYSPTTRNIKFTDTVRVTGIIEYEGNKCWWDEPEYGGCVPWVAAEKIEIIK